MRSSAILIIYNEVARIDLKFLPDVDMAISITQNESRISTDFLDRIYWMPEMQDFVSISIFYLGEP